MEDPAQPVSRIPNPATQIRKVGIVGEGKMGSGIFHYMIDFPFDLVWVCSPEADTNKLARQFEKRIRRSFDAGIMDRQRFDDLLKTSINRELTSLQSCDLVIEAVPEILELKKSLFLQLDEIVKPEAIFTSNSSSVNPSEIAPAGQRTGKFTGLHFFYPVSLRNIVEFTVTGDTTEHTTGVVESFLHNIRRRFITLDEKNSFMLNRIFLDVQNEAFLIVQSGNCSYIQMDQLVKHHLFPFGIFDFCDSVGLDTMLSSVRNYTSDYPHKSYYAQLISTLSELVSQGRLGLKTQEGFYKYPIGEVTVEEPENSGEIIEHLRQTWFSSVKRFTAQAHLPIDEVNYAVKEYFDIPKGPFE